ncbi:MAG: type I-E CRISPR-associated protein Cse2/CasB [Dehalococcoidia bacterium]
MTTEQRNRPGAALVEHLERLVREDDRAALAQLRRALGQPVGMATEAHRHVLPFIRTEASLTEVADAYLIASLFALWHQGKDQPRSVSVERRTNLGLSFRLLPEEVRTGSVEGRFRALLNADREELSEHLRHAISLLRANDVAVDWSRLYGDVRGWGSDDRWVQREWARAYWGGTAPSGGERAAGDRHDRDDIDDADNTDDSTT